MPKRFIESAHPAIGPEIAAPERVTKAKKPSLAEAARQVPEPARSNLDDLMLEMMSLEDRMRSPGFSKQDRIFYDILKKQMEERGKAVENITDPAEKKYEKARLAQARERADIILHGKKEEEEKTTAQKARKAKISDVVSRGMKELETEEEPVAVETGRVAVSGEEEKPGYSMDKIIDLGESLDVFDKTFEEEDKYQTAEQHAKEFAAKGQRHANEAEEVIRNRIKPRAKEKVVTETEKIGFRYAEMVQATADKNELLKKYADRVYLQSHVLDGFIAKDKLYQAENALISAYRMINEFSGLSEEDLLSKKLGFLELRFTKGGKAVREAYKNYQELLNNGAVATARDEFDKEVMELRKPGADERAAKRNLGRGMAAAGSMSGRMTMGGLGK
jgi:hypothetical protein